MAGLNSHLSIGKYAWQIRMADTQGRSEYVI